MKHPDFVNELYEAYQKYNWETLKKDTDQEQPTNTTEESDQK